MLGQRGRRENDEWKASLNSLLSIGRRLASTDSLSGNVRLQLVFLDWQGTNRDAATVDIQLVSDRHGREA